MKMYYRAKRARLGPHTVYGQVGQLSFCCEELLSSNEYEQWGMIIAKKGVADKVDLW